MGDQSGHETGWTIRPFPGAHESPHPTDPPGDQKRFGAPDWGRGPGVAGKRGDILTASRCCGGYSAARCAAPARDSPRCSRSKSTAPGTPATLRFSASPARTLAAAARTASASPRRASSPRARGVPPGLVAAARWPGKGSAQKKKNAGTKAWSKSVFGSKRCSRQAGRQVHASHLSSFLPSALLQLGTAPEGGNFRSWKTSRTDVAKATRQGATLAMPGK